MGFAAKPWAEAPTLPDAANREPGTASPSASAQAAKSGAPCPAHLPIRPTSPVEKSTAPSNLGAAPISAVPSTFSRLVPGRLTSRRILVGSPGFVSTAAVSPPSVSPPSMASPTARRASSLAGPAAENAGDSAAENSATARAGGTASSPLRRRSESRLACLAAASIASRTGAPKTSDAEPSARSARSSGPKR